MYMAVKQKTRRIGVFAGVFDPVHAGHVGFALRAAREASMDAVYFLPERKPRHKTGVEHYGHRVAMLNTAIKPYEFLGLLEVVDRQFTVNRTLPQLLKAFSGAELVLLMGTDTFAGLPRWANVSRLISDVQFVVSVRNPDELQLATMTIATLGLPAANICVIDSDRPGVSSSKIRDALRQNLGTAGLLPSVSRYAKREWLYARVPHTKSA